MNKSANCLVLIVLLAIGTMTFIPLPAREPASSNTMAFFGRWDVRIPGRAITVNGGSYVRVRFQGTAITALFDTSQNKDPFPTLAWKIDNGPWQEDDVAASVSLGNKLAGGPHSLCLMVRGLDEHQSRWSPPLIASVNFLGFDLSNGTLLPPLRAWTHPKLKIEFLGDSITEGVLVGGGKKGATWPWLTNALLSWPAQTAMMLGAEWRQVGFGATGIGHGGNGGAISALDSFNLFYQGCPRDEWQPDIVVINQGTNDGDPTEAYTILYLKYLTLVRHGYPKARIVALRPFSGRQAAAIKEAVATFRSAGDKNSYYIDTTGWYTLSIHPPFQVCPSIAAKLSGDLKGVLLTAP